MARSLTVGSSLTAVSSNTDSISLPGNGLNAITQYNLVSIEESGRVRPTDIWREISEENTSNTAGPVVLTTYTSAASSPGFNNSNQCWIPKMARLTSGNFVITENYGNSNQDTQFSIITPKNASVKATTNVSTSYTSVNKVTPIALTTGGFVVIQTNGSTNNALVGTIYNNSGTVTTATASLVTGLHSPNSASGQQWYGASLAGGKFVLAYVKSSPFNVCFKIFNSDGTQSVAETQIGSLVGGASSASDLMSILVCSNGDFIVYYHKATTGYQYCARYTSSGVIVGSVLTLSSSGGSLSYQNNNLAQLMAELSNGSIIAAHIRSTGTYYSVSIIPSAHTAVTTTVALSNFAITATSPCSLAASPDGTWAAVYGAYNAGPCYMTIYNNSGTVVIPEFSGLNSGSDTDCYRSIFSIPYVGWALYVAGNAAGTITPKIAVFNLLGNALGSTVSLSTTSIGMSFPTIIFLNGVLYITNSVSNSVYFGSYRVTRSSIIGVALETAAANASAIQISTKGVYSLTNSNTGWNANTFDQTTSSYVGGTKGSIVGTTAIIKGLV